MANGELVSLCEEVFHPLSHNACRLGDMVLFLHLGLLNDCATGYSDHDGYLHSDALFFSVDDYLSVLYEGVVNA